MYEYALAVLQRSMTSTLSCILMIPSAPGGTGLSVRVLNLIEYDASISACWDGILWLYSESELQRMAMNNTVFIVDYFLNVPATRGFHR